jgi:hypothetical protein
MELPMLDEAEFAVVSNLYCEAMHATKEYRQRYGLPLDDCPISELFRPVRDAYKRMAGFDEANENAIMHHRISIYGPPCETCGKPLRTPQARICAACWAPRSEAVSD